MKAIVTKKVEVNIKFILIEIAPRYIGDSEDDDMRTDTPLLINGKWTARIDVDTGQVESWPIGKECEFFVKVCDEGVYTLFDDESNVIATMAGYAPNEIVPGEYGDYVHMIIGPDGIVKNWPSNPSVEEFFERED